MCGMLKCYTGVPPTARILIIRMLYEIMSLNCACNGVFVRNRVVGGIAVHYLVEVQCKNKKINLVSGMTCRL